MKIPLIWIEKGVNASYSRHYLNEPTKHRQSHQIYMYKSNFLFQRVRERERGGGVGKERERRGRESVSLPSVTYPVYK